MGNQVDDGIKVISDEVFPFGCANPLCSVEYDQKEFAEALNLCGLIYAKFANESASRDFIFIGITCRECHWTTPIFFRKDDEVIDLRNLIISPNPDKIANIYEQILQTCEREEKGNNKLLQFNTITALKEETVSFYEVKEYFRKRLPLDQLWDNLSISYLLPSREFLEARMREEERTGKIRLRRLYPDTERFRNLLMSICHDRSKAVRLDDGTIGFEMTEASLKELEEKRNAWLRLLEEMEGKSFKEYAEYHLKKVGVKKFNDAWFGGFLEAYSWSFHFQERLRFFGNYFVSAIELSKRKISKCFQKGFDWLCPIGAQKRFTRLGQ